MNLWPMRFYLGVTDNGWYSFLAAQNREDVNFWQPGGSAGFKVIAPGAPFLFKLKSPINAVGGIGFFSSHTFLPISVAWDVFGQGNGCNSFADLQRMIFAYRKNDGNMNPTIGCIVLTNPIFFEQQDWIETPADWSKSIVQGKSYSTEEQAGRDLWTKIERQLQKYLYPVEDEKKNQLILEEPAAQYGNSVLTKVRLGQAAFRVLVTDAYNRKCAISGEKTLPVLDAVHIKAYAESGPHFISNSLLLRSDLHKLFDSGYLTITTDLRVEVSRRIKEEFQNGKEYYQYHGSSIANLPPRIQDRPDSEFIQWHNEHIYVG
jgi:putative restriction endonuclease